MTRSSSQSGFTLVETLVALAIVGISLAVLLKVISDNLDHTRRARDETAAAAIVQSLLAQAETGTPRIGNSRGKTPDGYDWQVRVAPAAGGENRDNWPVQAVSISATISWRDGGRTQARTLTTTRVVPKVAE